MPLDLQILGIGVYTPAEAARLAGVRSRDVRRWTRGAASAQPIWHGYYREMGDSTEISFRDMLEVRVVGALRRAGVSLQAIRFAIRHASAAFGVDHPLSSRRFRTDGTEILMEALDTDGDLTSLSQKHPGQRVFRLIVEQSLIDLEYEADDPVRWRPTKFQQVVVDPSRAFGDPILDESSISSRVVGEEREMGRSIKQISAIYEIPAQQVRAALGFERYLDGQAPV